MQKQTEAAKVIGSGVLVSGASFYLVSSQSEDGRSHVVEQRPARLACDCRGYVYRGKCAHVAAVVAHKAALELARVEAEERARLDEVAAVHASQQDTARHYAALAAGRVSHGTVAASHPGDTALLRRDNRPFAERFMR